MVNISWIPTIISITIITVSITTNHWLPTTTTTTTTTTTITHRNDEPTGVPGGPGGPGRIVASLSERIPGGPCSPRVPFSPCSPRSPFSPWNWAEKTSGLTLVANSHKLNLLHRNCKLEISTAPTRVKSREPAYSQGLSKTKLIDTRPVRSRESCRQQLYTYW